MPRILLIEDDEMLRQTLRDLLACAGHELLEAEHGRAGLELLAEQPADLVITDMIMPEMEGVETIREIRRLYPALKVIAVCGDRWGWSGLYLDIAQKLGAQKLLTKPFHPDELLDAVKQLLGDQAGGSDRSM